MELKYAYAIVQLFSHDMLSLLVSILLKLCQAYEQPAVHGAVLAGPQGFLLLSIVHPSLKLIRRLLCQLIRCRDGEFRDLTAVPVLLQTHALVSAVPASSLLHYKVAECCSDIVATLLAYSQPLLQTGDGNSVRSSNTSSVIKASTTPEDALSRSLWTQMVQEILKFVHTCSGPASFITGLQVLNEILPLPLPLFKELEVKPSCRKKMCKRYSTPANYGVFTCTLSGHKCSKLSGSCAALARNFYSCCEKCVSRLPISRPVLRLL